MFSEYTKAFHLLDLGKELFFWFVPTTNPAASDEIVLWLNVSQIKRKMAYSEHIAATWSVT